MARALAAPCFRWCGVSKQCRRLSAPLPWLLSEHSRGEHVPWRSSLPTELESSCPQPRCGRIRRLPEDKVKPLHPCRQEKKEILRMDTPDSTVPPSPQSRQQEN